MRLYVVANLDKVKDYTLFAPLTKKGLSDSKKLAKIFKKLNITHLYCSPYINALQTVYPYAKRKNLEIAIDYSLVDHIKDYLVSKKSFNNQLPRYIEKRFKGIDNYESATNNLDLKYNESDKDLNQRLINILRKIIMTHNKKDDNILIISHKIPINFIMKIGSKSNHTNIPKDYPSNYDYPEGGITKIFDKDKWNFEKINW